MIIKGTRYTRHVGLSFLDRDLVLKRSGPKTLGWFNSLGPVYFSKGIDLLERKKEV